MATGSIYEKLDLSTPATAVGEFMKAYEAGDFVAVYLIFDALAQETISDGAANLNAKATTRPDYRIGFALHELGFSSAPEYLFDAWMDEARSRKQMLLELEGNYSIVLDRPEADLADGRSTVLISVEHDGGVASFLLSQAASERWRVVSVASGEALPDPGQPLVGNATDDQYGNPICVWQGIVVFELNDCEIFEISPFSKDPLSDQLERLCSRRASSIDREQRSRPDGRTDDDGRAGRRCSNLSCTAGALANRAVD